MIEEKLKSLGIELPVPIYSQYNYVPVTIHNGFAYVSGQVARGDQGIEFPGQVGTEVSLAEAKKSAEICLLRALSHLKKTLGSLERIDRVIKVNGYVKSAVDFIEQPKVIDAASKLLIEIFGEKGEHARTAVGVASLPSNTPVEIEFIFALKD